jgi:hypothetical protein
MKMQMKLCGIAMLVGMSFSVKAQTDPYDDDIYYSTKDKKHYVSHINASDINKSNASSSASSNQNSAGNQNYSGNNSGNNYSSGNSNASGSNGSVSKNSGDTYITNNYNGSYSTRLRRFYGPSVGLSYYNSFYDPFAYSYPYYGYNAFGYGYPYSSGFSIGFGWGSPGYTCFNSGYCGYNSFGYGGYNSFGYGGYNPYGYNNFGYGYNGFNSYNNGFYNGYNYGLYNSYNNNYTKPYYKESYNSNAPASTYGRSYDASTNYPPDGSTDQRSVRSSNSMDKMQLEKSQSPSSGKQENPGWVDPRGERGSAHISNVPDNSNTQRSSNNNNYTPPVNTPEAPQRREWVDPRGERGERGTVQEQRQAAPQYQYPEPQERRRNYSEPTYSAPTYSAPAPSYGGGGGGGGSSSSGADTWGRRR